MRDSKTISQLDIESEANMLWMIPSLALAVTPISGDDIIRRADEARVGEDAFSFKVTVEDYQNNEKIRKMCYRVYNLGIDKSIIRTLYPATQQGRNFLATEENIYLYTPQTGRSVQVAFQNRLTDGQVANGDLARTAFHRDYKAVGSLSTEVVNDRKTYVVNLQQRRRGVTYHSIRLWVDKQTFLPLRAQFRTSSGRVLKSGMYQDYQPTLGARMAHRVIFRDHIQEGNYSVLNYSEFKSENLSDAFFSREALGDTEPVGNKTEC